MILCSLIQVAQDHSQRRCRCAIIVLFIQLLAMTDLILHDDYETFATRYLGIDYDDYVNLELGLQDDEDGIEIEYSIAI